MVSINKFRYLPEGVSSGDVPKCFQVSEKMLEKFPKKEPLEDPPYKGKTAKKNKERPTIQQVYGDGYKGLKIALGRFPLFVLEGGKAYGEKTGYVVKTVRPEDPDDPMWDDALPYHPQPSYVKARKQIPLGEEHPAEYDWEILGYTEDFYTVAPHHQSSNNFKRVALRPIFTSLEKEVFKVDFLRTEVYLDAKTMTLKYGAQYRAVFNAASNVFQLFRNNKEVENTKDILGGCNLDEACEQVFHKDRIALYKMAYNRLGAMDDERSPNIGRALKRFRYFKAVEVLHNAGWSEDVLRLAFESIQSRLTRQRTFTEGASGRRSYHHTYKLCWHDMKSIYERVSEHSHYFGGSLIVNPAGTKPQDILCLPKWALKDENVTALLDRVEFSTDAGRVLRRLQRQHVLGNRTEWFKPIIESVETSDVEVRRYSDTKGFLLEKTISMILEGTLKNWRRFVDYLTFDIQFTQGITNVREGMTLLEDYYMMCENMGIAPIKFPKSLKLTHDVASFNQSKISDEEQNIAFQRAMEQLSEMKPLDYVKKNYRVDPTFGKVDWRILVPQSPKELVQEGNNLNHCVGSYVDNVAKRKTNIIFLREFYEEVKDDEDGKSLLTIEVKETVIDDIKVMYVHQVRGSNNRLPSGEENDFLEEWCKRVRIFRSESMAKKFLSQKQAPATIRDFKVEREPAFVI